MGVIDRGRIDDGIGIGIGVDIVCGPHSRIRRGAKGEVMGISWL